MNQFRGIVVVVLVLVSGQLNGGMGLGFLTPAMSGGFVVLKRALITALSREDHRSPDETMGLLYEAGSSELVPDSRPPALTVVGRRVGGGAAGGSGAPADAMPRHPHAFPLFDGERDGVTPVSSARSRRTEGDEAELELSAALAALAAEAGDVPTPLEKAQAAINTMRHPFTRVTLPSRNSKEEWTMGKGTPATCSDSGFLSPTVGVSPRNMPTLKEQSALGVADVARETTNARYGNIASMLRLSDYYWTMAKDEGDKDGKRRQELYERALTFNMRAFILIGIDLDLREQRTTIRCSEKVAIMTRLSLRYKKYNDEELKKGPRSALLTRIRSDIFLNLQEQVTCWYALTRDWLLELFDDAEPFALTREQIKIRPAQWGSVLWRMLTYD